MPSPEPNNKNDEVMEEKRRLKREVVHRLASGNKCHSEMTEVCHALSARENLVLGETFVNPDDAGGAALEDALSEVAIRKQKSGAPDEWELRKDAWNMYDPGEPVRTFSSSPVARRFVPLIFLRNKTVSDFYGILAFHHISTRDHQGCAENRPKPSGSVPYAPRPAPAHGSFQRIRRDVSRSDEADFSAFQYNASYFCVVLFVLANVAVDGRCMHSCDDIQSFAYSLLSKCR